MVTPKDILRAATQCIRHATADSDGQSVLDAIDEYVDGLDDGSGGAGATTDAAVIDKLSNELLSLCTNTVLHQQSATVISCRPEAAAVHNQHYLILQFVRRLLTVLRPSRIFQDWWDPILKPILTSASYTDQIKKESEAIVSESLIEEQRMFRAGEITEPKYCRMIVEQYLAWAETYHKREEYSIEQLEQPSDQDTTVRLRLQALLDLEQDEWSKNLTIILLNLGAAETKSFFTLLNSYFMSSRYRLQIVYLLSEFMLRKRTHLHEILETPLFGSMLKSLMYDNSTTLIAISVTNMIMLLPRICTSLPPFLPQLFYIFARAICWDQLRDLRKKQGTQTTAAGHETPLSAAGASRVVDGWDCVDYTFSKLAAPPSNPQTGPFFTSLYGLYPCNFVNFLHRPYDYFNRNDFQVPEEFEEETFRSRTMTQVIRHMLHPNLITSDAETELTDRSRWMKMEPPDVIAQIMSLDLTNAATRVAFTVGTDRPRSQQQDLLNETIWAHTGRVAQPVSTGSESVEKPSDHHNDSIAIDTKFNEPVTDPKKKPVMISNILNIHRALKSGAEVLVGDDVWEAGIERLVSPSSPAANSPMMQDTMPLTAVAAASDTLTDAARQGKDKTSTSSDTRLLIAALKREVLLLRNELNFELFLKQQHLQHIGRLHREHVLDSSVEAERQQLYNTTRMLKAELKQATAALEKLKAESAMTKSKHVKWEDEQSNKLRNYREARKEWQSQMETAKQKITEYEGLLEEQRFQLTDARKQVFELQNELKTLQPSVEKMEELEHRVKQLTRQMLLWEEDTAHMEEQKRYIKGLLSQWWGMEELITSLQTENRALEERQSQRDSELEQLKIEMKSCQSRISHLDQVSASPKSDSGNDRKEASRLQTMVDELKQRVEQLEVRNLQYQMDLEKARHEEEKFKKLAALSETASHDASGFRRSFDEQAPADMDQTTARHVAPGVNRSLSVTDAEIGLHTHPTAVSRSISDPKHPVLREDDTKHH